MKNNDMITLNAEELYQLELKLFDLQTPKIFADCVTIIYQLSRYAGKHGGKVPSSGIPLPKHIDALAIIRVYSEVLGQTPTSIQEQNNQKIAIF